MRQFLHFKTPDEKNKAGFAFLGNDLQKKRQKNLLNIYKYQYYTRHASQGDLYVSRKNSLQYGLKSIRYLGAKLWNTLPVEIRNAPSKISFKTRLKIHLLEKVNR